MSGTWRIKSRQLVAFNALYVDICIFFQKKFDLSKTVIAAVFIAWILGSLLPWGIVVKNGIKNQKTIQMWVGIFGLAAAVSFIASFLCFVKFGSFST